MTRYAWIPVVLVMLVPVVVVVFSHSSQHVHSASENGVLLTGIESLDSLLSSTEKTIVINFWATWCAPCVRELPMLDQLALELADEAVFVAVDIGDPDLSTLQLFRQSNTVGIPVIWLSADQAEVISERYSLGDALPETVILNSQGIEIARAVGVRNRDWFQQEITGAEAGSGDEIQPEIDVHIYVVGSDEDPVVTELVQKANSLAGEQGVDHLDPEIREDSIRMAEAYLPMSGYPYAQLCVGGACRPPVGSAHELQEAWDGMQ